MATSGTIKASLKGRDLKVRSSSCPLGLVLEVHCVFNQRDVPSMNGSKSRAKVIA